MIEETESSSEKLKVYEARIQALEQSLCQKQMELEYFEKLIEIAENHYAIDI